MHFIHWRKQTNKATKHCLHVYVTNNRGNKQTFAFMHLADTFIQEETNKQTNITKNVYIYTFSRHFYLKRLAIEETNKHLHSCISRQLYPIEESNKQTMFIFIYLTDTFIQSNLPNKGNKQTNQQTNIYMYIKQILLSKVTSNRGIKQTNYVYIYTFNRHIYPKRHTIEETNKQRNQKKQLFTFI